jgi:hypothetical protein
VRFKPNVVNNLSFCWFSYERALAIRAAQEAKKFSRITREEKTPPKLKFGSVFTAVDSNLLYKPSTLSEEPHLRIKITFCPGMACSSCNSSTFMALSPLAIKHISLQLPPLFSSPTPFTTLTPLHSVRNPSTERVSAPALQDH